MELSDVAPFTEVLTVTGKLSRFPVPLRFSTFMHNSMHPIWVPELSAFLGVVRNPAANIFAHRATHPLALSLGAFLTHFHPPVPACLIFKYAVLLRAVPTFCRDTVIYGRATMPMGELFLVRRFSMVTATATSSSRSTSKPGA